MRKVLAVVIVIIPAAAQAGQLPWIGIRVCARRPAVVQEVFPGSPAAEAGLQAEDEILSVEAEGNVEDMQDEVRDVGVGNPVRVRVRRNGAVDEMSIVLGPRSLETPAKGTTVYVALIARASVNSGDPLAADNECHNNCYARVPACDPVIIEAVGSISSTAHWKGRLIKFKGDLRQRAYQDKATCERDAKDRCGAIL